MIENPKDKNGRTRNGNNSAINIARVLETREKKLLGRSGLDYPPILEHSLHKIRM